MAKSRKGKQKQRKQTRKSTSSGKTPLSITQANPAQRRISREKERMLSTLSFEEHLREQIEDMFNINLDGLPPGQEPMFFSTAVFKVDDAESVIAKIEKLPDVHVSGENDDGMSYTWTRAYPKGHWNPLSRLGGRHVIGDIRINYDNTLKLETRTKGWMTALIYHVISVLGKDIKLISLEFQNPLDMLRR